MTGPILKPTPTWHQRTIDYELAVALALSRANELLARGQCAAAVQSARQGYRAAFARLRADTDRIL